MPPVERAFWPFCPRPAVLPRPEPTPRPARVFAVFAPTGAWIFESLSDIGVGLPDRAWLVRSVGFLDGHEVNHFFDRAAERRRVVDDDGRVRTAQAEAAHRHALIVRTPRETADLRHLQLFLHDAAP